MIPTFPIPKSIKEYHGLFTQTGTDNPVVTVLHNTLGGDVTWVRISEGVYEGQTDGLLTVNKTFTEQGGQNPNSRITTYTGGASVDSIQLKTQSNSNNISLLCFGASNSLTPAEYSVMGGEFMVKIYVYQ